MHALVLIVHVLASLGLVTLVLLQHGKGADMGAAFGSGASQTLFGARGSANFLTRMTGGLATVFFVTSLSLAYFATQEAAGPTSVIQQQPAPQTAPADTVPAVPAVPEDAPPGAPPAVPR